MSDYWLILIINQVVAANQITDSYVYTNFQVGDLAVSGFQIGDPVVEEPLAKDSVIGDL